MADNRTNKSSYRQEQTTEQYQGNWEKDTRSKSLQKVSKKVRSKELCYEQKEERLYK